MSLTCAPGGENHAGMEIIGRMPFKGEGFTASDLRGVRSYFVGVMGEGSVELLELNKLSGVKSVMELDGEDEGVVLVLRKKGMEKLIEKYGKPLIDMVIKIDDLTPEEIKDYEYLEDRIITHLEWSTIDK